MFHVKHMPIGKDPLVNLSEWFTPQLQSGADGFVWAVRQVPQERWEAKPPKALGEWPMAQHVFHMLFYEREMVLPHMRHWLGVPLASLEDWQKIFSQANASWTPQLHVENMITDFLQVRAEQIAMLQHFDDTLWHEARPNTIWGEVPLKWIVSKTFQHTAEHTNDIMRMALFWDAFAQREQQQ